MQNQFQITAVSLAVLSALMPVSVYANNKQTADSTSSEAVLDMIEVRVARELGRKSTEITGLGKIVKSSDDINREQIMGIRDLTRYDPGISVVEQGRGATSGYSIRGVDKNRVGLQVDGLVQIQSYITEHSRANGGSINEIEYENVRSIELSKGSASSEFGSGALGGAVSFRTKEVSDIIKDDKNWGVSSKTAYSSKNNQLANTLALAGKAGGFEGLLQYTHRKGQETEVHKEATSLVQTFTRAGVYSEDSTFLINTECPNGNCGKKPIAKLTWHTLPDGKKHITETVSAENYTGSGRIMPNPMEYESKSLFSKIGYRFNDAHYIGAVLENTKQRYDIQDMSRPSYITPKELRSDDQGISITKGIYLGSNPSAGISLLGEPISPSLLYARGYYFDEHHDKNRYGVFYKYTSENGWINDLKISYDHQSIDVNTFRQDTNCSIYPNFDKNCRADASKPLSAYTSEQINYQEQHNVLQFDFEKRFDIAKTSHRMNLLTGADHFKSKLTRGEFFAEQAKYHNPSDRFDVALFKNIGNGVYELRPITVVHTEYCKNGFGTQDCTNRNITGYNRFISIKDHIAFGDKVDLGLGVRYDQHNFKSSDRFTSTGKYNNWSWNVGLTVKPTENIALSYRRSNGFRVPAFYELYGRRGALDTSNSVSLARQHVTDLTPEKASNQEIGIGLSGYFGYLEVSYFDNKYRDLIVTAKKKLAEGGTSADGYHNLQDITLSGINLLGKLDWYAISNIFPDGLYSTLAYNRIRPKHQSVKDGYTEVRSPILDTLQPARYIVGIGYDDPSEKWGVNLMATYSKAKNANELQGISTFGVDRGIVATKGATRSWYIYDLSGYYVFKDTFTLRAGIYNLFNRKYSAWESVRQSSINAVNQTSGNSARYAAPGRNFSLAFEMKF